jgi:AraC-like DNA-binding protein
VESALIKPLSFKRHRYLGDTSISEIAYRLGYADVVNFSHAFRRMNGRSPRAWARAARAISSPIENPSI